jgi:iron complex outermembrane receptor protein
MGSFKASNALQKDSLFRSYIAYDRKSEKFNFSVRSAWLSDFLSYTDKNSQSDTVYSINSRIGTSRLMNDASIRYFLTHSIITGAGFSFNLINGNSNNYGGHIQEHEYAAYTNIKLIHRNWIINAGLRKEFYQEVNAPLQYSLGIRFKLNDAVVFRSSFSSKFRKPTFNEKYWKPGGNPNLNPEQGRGGEIALEWLGTGSKNDPLWLAAKLSFYHETIDNWIQWVLADSLTPIEYKKVRTAGIESSIEYGLNAGLLSISGRTNYNYNKATILSTFDQNDLYEGKQLIYTPLHTIRSFLEFVYNGYMAGISASWSDERETVETGDPLYRLPAYMIFDFSTGIHKKVRNTDISLFFAIDNVFDHQYEIIRSYPNPGRTCRLCLSVGLNKTRSEN